MENQRTAWQRLVASAGPLIGHRDFLLLWAGQGISELGSHVSQLAIPTVAILLLHAGPLQVGLLTALEFLAFPVLGLFVGVYADRLHRRPIMIACDIGRALLLASIPIAYGLGHLTLGQLYVLALLTGICSVFFGISYQAYLPSLVEREHMVEANAKLELASSVAQLGGPAMAGLLIQWLRPARALWVDAASFVVSVVSLAAIRRPEVHVGDRTVATTGFWAEMGEGIRVVAGNSTLWKIAGSTATSNLGSNMVFAVLLIFFYRQLHLTPGQVGLVFALGATGALVGALAAGWVVDRVGVGTTLLISIVLTGIALALVPLASWLPPLPTLVALGFAGGLASVYNITQVSLRQRITPDRLQGRMNATMRTIVWGTMPIGALLGGVLGARAGLVPTIVVGGLVAVSAGFWILAGPITIQGQPEAVAP